MNTIFKRIGAGTVLAAAPVLIALGTAAAGHAESTVNTNPGPTISRPTRTSCSPPRTSSCRATGPITTTSGTAAGKPFIPDRRQADWRDSARRPFGVKRERPSRPTARGP